MMRPHGKSSCLKERWMIAPTRHNGNVPRHLKEQCNPFGRDSTSNKRARTATFSKSDGSRGGVYPHLRFGLRCFRYKPWCVVFDRGTTERPNNEEESR